MPIYATTIGCGPFSSRYDYFTEYKTLSVVFNDISTVCFFLNQKATLCLFFTFGDLILDFSPHIVEYQHIPHFSLPFLLNTQNDLRIWWFSAFIVTLNNFIKPRHDSAGMLGWAQSEIVPANRKKYYLLIVCCTVLVCITMEKEKKKQLQ